MPVAAPVPAAPSPVVPTTAPGVGQSATASAASPRGDRLTGSPGREPGHLGVGHLHGHQRAVGGAHDDAAVAAEEAGADHGCRAVGRVLDVHPLGAHQHQGLGAARRAGQQRHAAAEQEGGGALDPGPDPVGQPDEVGDERRLRGAVELGRRGQLLEPAHRHHPDPVGDREGLLLVVGDEQRGRADLELDAADLVAQLGAHLGVEGRERLVEQQHLGLDRQGAGQRHALLLAAGELVGVLVGVRPRGRRGRASRRCGPGGWRGRGRAARGRTRRSGGRSCAGTGCTPGTPSPCRACWRAPG